MKLPNYAGITDEEARTVGDLLTNSNTALKDHVIDLRRLRRIKLPDAIIAATALECGYNLLPSGSHRRNELNTVP